jgi:hypothetical protein
MLTADSSNPIPNPWTILTEVEEYYTTPTTEDQTIATIIDDISSFREAKDLIPGAAAIQVEPQGEGYILRSKRQDPRPVSDIDAMLAHRSAPPKRRMTNRRAKY